MMNSKSTLSLGIYFLSILTTSNAQYSLAATYNAANFFNDFTFFTAADPTAGYVVYEPLAAAEEAGLVSTANNQVYLGVDHTTLNPSGGRESVRLTSNQAWGEGMKILCIDEKKTDQIRRLHSRYRAHAGWRLWYMARILDVWSKLAK